jgi:Cysteine-rich CPCC
VLPAEPCPCCGYRTLPERGYFELCPVCWWEDDPGQADQPWAWGGPNGISLVEAQQAYLRYGAKAVEDVSRVRAPHPDETRDLDWRPHDPADGELHSLYTEEEERASEARGREDTAAFQSGLEALRAEAGNLTDGELAGRCASSARRCCCTTGTRRSNWCLAWCGTTGGRADILFKLSLGPGGTGARPHCRRDCHSSARAPSGSEASAEGRALAGKTANALRRIFAAASHAICGMSGWPQRAPSARSGWPQRGLSAAVSDVLSGLDAGKGSGLKR